MIRVTKGQFANSYDISNCHYPFYQYYLRIWDKVIGLSPDYVECVALVILQDLKNYRKIMEMDQQTQLLETLNEVNLG